MSEPLWTSADAEVATGGRATSAWQADGVSIDTRTLAPGDLFVALEAVRDGHDFVREALEKGAAAALVSRVPPGLADDAPLLIVDDVLDGLVDLGRAARARSAARVLAVTGSVGKTTTKEMLRAALNGQGQIHAAEASYNNHWGVPLTLARMPIATDFAIIEIGMNHPGEIAPLARLARPQVALITTIAAAHLEAFDDLAGIAVEKLSIVEGLEPGGLAVLPTDVDAGVAPVLERHDRDVIRFGTGDGATWRLSDLHQTDDALVVRAETPKGPALIALRAPGRHLALNALGALAASVSAGGDLALSAQGLGRWEPPKGRGRRETVALDPVTDRHFTLIDDAFNANPASMAAALDDLVARTPDARGRRIAFLGDMLELGPTEAQLHAELARHPGIGTLDVIHCAGPRIRATYDALPLAIRGNWAETAEELTHRLREMVGADDIVLVKGSKGAKTARIVDGLRALGRRDPSMD